MPPGVGVIMGVYPIEWPATGVCCERTSHLDAPRRRGVGVAPITRLGVGLAHFPGVGVARKALLREGVWSQRLVVRFGMLCAVLSQSDWLAFDYASVVSSDFVLL